MFNNMPSIVSIGYDYTDPEKKTNVGARSIVDYNGTKALLGADASTTFNVGFSGNGYHKTLRGGTFPYNILQNVGKKVSSDN